MAGPLRPLGRRLRSLVLPLVGFWQLREQLDRITERLARLETGTAAAAAEARQSELRLGERVTEQGASLSGMLRAIASRTEMEPIIPEELKRRLAELGGELGFKTDIANGKLEEVLQAVLALTGPGTTLPDLAAIRGAMASEIDRLDGYLVHHANELHAAITRPSGSTAIVGPGIEMVIPCGGFDFVVPTEETYLLMLVLRGTYATLEPGTSAVLRSLVKPGSVVIDAGANIGLHTLPLAAAVGETGQVHCFEPLPHLAAALRRAVRVNDLGARTTVHDAALADASGEALLNRAAHSPESSLYPLPEQPEAQAIPVRLTSLDESFPPGTRIDLIKIDVEGAEPRVWRGMTRVLADNPRMAIAMEWSGSHFRRSGEDPSAFMGAIHAAGFTVQVIEDDPVPGHLAALPADIGALERQNILLTRGM